jgi:hypothetical protein
VELGVLAVVLGLLGHKDPLVPPAVTALEVVAGGVYYPEPVLVAEVYKVLTLGRVVGLVAAAVLVLKIFMLPLLLAVVADGVRQGVHLESEIHIPMLEKAGKAEHLTRLAMMELLLVAQAVLRLLVERAESVLTSMEIPQLSW